MTDKNFEKYIRQRTNYINPETGKLDLRFNPLDCHCSINVPMRSEARTPEERLERAEFMARMTWKCMCKPALEDCLRLLIARREVQALSSNGQETGHHCAPVVHGLG